MVAIYRDCKWCFAKQLEKCYGVGRVHFLVYYFTIKQVFFGLKLEKENI